MAPLTRTITDMERFRGVKEGEILRWYEGVITYDPARRVHIVAPIPLNLIVRFIGNTWSSLRSPAKRDLVSWSYNLGYSDGYADKERQSLLDVLKKMRRK